MMHWDVAFVVRLGCDFGGNVLSYVEAGVAFANATWSYDFGGGDSGSDDQSYVGWVIGAGVQFALADNLTANVEARYADYGTQTFFDEPEVGLTDTSVRVGIDYHF